MEPSLLLSKHPNEVTTYRCDGEYLDGRRPDSVQFVSRIEEDLARRDFTINAMAYHPRGIAIFIMTMKTYLRVIRAVGEPKVRLQDARLPHAACLAVACRLVFQLRRRHIRHLLSIAPLSRVASGRIGSEVAQIVEGCVLLMLYQTGFSCSSDSNSGNSLTTSKL